MQLCSVLGEVNCVQKTFPHHPPNWWNIHLLCAFTTFKKLSMLSHFHCMCIFTNSLTHQITLLFILPSLISSHLPSEFSQKKGRWNAAFLHLYRHHNHHHLILILWWSPRGSFATIWSEGKFHHIEHFNLLHTSDITSGFRISVDAFQ